MTIYTSYFARAKDLPRSIVPIAICRKPPHWFRWNNRAVYNYNYLAPTAEIFRLPEAEYVPRFRNYLSTLSAPHVLRDLISIRQMQIAGRDDWHDVALLCYERPEKFCHRHLVAEWLSAQLGISVQEYEYPHSEPPNSSDNFSLFE